MRSRLKKIIALALILAAALSVTPAPAKAAVGYTAPYTTIRVGIFTLNDDGSVNQKVFPSANLENAVGYGYELGYYDANRDFVSLGVFITDTNQITMMMDRNMVYNSGSNSYSEGTDGNIVVGAIHLRLDGSYGTYYEAKAVADRYQNSFVRYDNGTFRVLVGQYTSTPAASAAASSLGAPCQVDSGSAYTVTVVRSRSNQILFEFDCGTAFSLGVRPISTDGSKTQTYFKNNTYYGGFSYLRNTGGSLSVVNYVDVEDYVRGVVPWEMSPSWPLEALKAQAITARTYIMSNINKHRVSGFDVCNTTDCQAYHGTSRSSANTEAAVEETKSQYLVYNGALCQTNYYSSNGGASENSENVWTEALPYQRGVRDPYEKNVAGTVSNYYWTKTYTPATLGARLREVGFGTCSDVVHIDMTFTEMGNVFSITFTDRNGRSFTASKNKARTVPSARSLRYTVNGLGPAEAGQVYVNGGEPLDNGLNGAFVVGSGGIYQLPSADVYAVTGSGNVEKVDTSNVTKKGGVGVNSSGQFVFSGSGWGHNVGMSQWGAYSMALYYNMTCEEILTFYYTGTTIATSPRQEQQYIPAPQPPLYEPPTDPAQTGDPGYAGDLPASGDGTEDPGSPGDTPVSGDGTGDPGEGEDGGTTGDPAMGSPSF